MCRTTLNVTGDLAAAVVVARGEPHLVLEGTRRRGRELRGRYDRSAPSRSLSPEACR